MNEAHCESALRHIQRVVALASSANAPITMSEAIEQIVETLDLAGFAPLSARAPRAKPSGLHVQ